MKSRINSSQSFSSFYNFICMQCCDALTIQDGNANETQKTKSFPKNKVFALNVTKSVFFCSLFWNLQCGHPKVRFENLEEIKLVAVFQ